MGTVAMPKDWRSKYTAEKEVASADGTAYELPVEMVNSGAIFHTGVPPGGSTPESNKTSVPARELGLRQGKFKVNWFA